MSDAKVVCRRCLAPLSPGAVPLCAACEAVEKRLREDEEVGLQRARELETQRRRVLLAVAVLVAGAGAALIAFRKPIAAALARDAMTPARKGAKRSLEVALPVSAAPPAGASFGGQGASFVLEQPAPPAEPAPPQPRRRANAAPPPSAYAALPEPEKPVLDMSVVVGQRRVYGVVYDLITAQPVPGAMVSFTEVATGNSFFRFPVDQWGQYSALVPLGALRVTVTAKGYRKGQLEDTGVDYRSHTVEARARRADETTESDLEEAAIPESASNPLNMDFAILPKLPSRR